MHSNYRLDERIIKDIVLKNTKCNNPNKKLNFITYYKNPKTSNLIMKNNITSPPSKLQTSNVVYKFVCPHQHGKAEETYIGETTTSLSRRLTMHKQSGSISRHFYQQHNCNVTRQQLTDNTVILVKEQNKQKLLIKEALLILKHSPTINIQFDNFTNILKLHKQRNIQFNGINNQPQSHTHNNSQSVISEPNSQSDPTLDPVINTIDNQSNPEINNSTPSRTPIPNPRTPIPNPTTPIPNSTTPIPNPITPNRSHISPNIANRINRLYESTTNHTQRYNLRIRN